MENDEVRSKFEKAKKIAICLPEDPDKEIVYSALILCEFINSIGKESSLLVASSLDRQLKKLFEERSIAIQSNAKPISYVVSIDYGKSNIDSITYDRDDDKNILYFYITPSNGDFDFKNVEFSTEGSSYDLIITIGVKSFKDIGSVYEDNKELFSKTDVVSIVKGNEKLGDNSFNIPTETSMIYGVRTFIGDDISEDLSTEILARLIELEPVIEGEPRDNFYSELKELSESGAKFSDAIKQKYFKKTFSNLDLQIKIMHNIQLDRGNRVIWSKVNHDDMKFCNINEETLDVSGRIIFNISEDFDLAFAVYEIEKSNLFVICESNDPSKYSAIKIASVFNGTGDDSHAVFTINNMPIKDFEKNVFIVLKDIYGIEVEGKMVGFRTGSLEDKDN